jgi:hypothetical protein
MVAIVRTASVRHVNRRPALVVGRRGDAVTSKIVGVKKRSARLASLAARVVPVAALLLVVENAEALASGGPRTF